MIRQQIFECLLLLLPKCIEYWFRRALLIESVTGNVNDLIYRDKYNAIESWFTVGFASLIHDLREKASDFSSFLNK